jgi:hypothetical protein
VVHTAGVRNIALKVSIAALMLVAMISLADCNLTVLHVDDCCGGATSADPGVPAVSR